MSALGISKKVGRKATSIKSKHQSAIAKRRAASIVGSLQSTLGDGEAKQTIVETARVQSEADSSFPGQLQDRVGRGREVAFSTDSRGRQQVVKSTSISMDELETLILPTRGKKEMINRMGQMGLSARYPEYHQHTLQYSVNDNPTISRLHVNPECPSRAL